jgi:hypothetical protein
VTMDFSKQDKEREVIIDYTNWKEVRSKRRISPVGVTFEANQYHQEPQWLLWAIENKNGENVIRSFAMKNIHSWEAAK